MGSPCYPLTNFIKTNSPAAKIKLSWEQFKRTTVEDAAAMQEDLSAVAGE